MTEQDNNDNTSFEALAAVAILSLLVGVIIGIWTTTQIPTSNQDMAVNHDYTFRYPGEKLQIKNNETHHVVVGCISEKLDYEYYRLNYDSGNEQLNILKVKEGGQESFFAATFNECIVPRSSGHHLSYDTQSMDLRTNGSKLKYNIKNYDGEWVFTDVWIEQ